MRCSGVLCLELPDVQTEITTRPALGAQGGEDAARGSTEELVNDVVDVVILTSKVGTAAKSEHDTSSDNVIRKRHRRRSTAEASSWSYR